MTHARTALMTGRRHLKMRVSHKAEVRNHARKKRTGCESDLKIDSGDEMRG